MRFNHTYYTTAIIFSLIFTACNNVPGIEEGINQGKPVQNTANTSEKATMDSLTAAEKRILISKKWAIDSVDMGHHMHEDKKHVYEQMLNEFRDKSSFEFKDDMTYEAVFDGNQLEEGSWKLNDCETMILTVRGIKNADEEDFHDAASSPDRIHIDHLSPESIVLSRKEPDDNIITVYLVPADE